MASKRGLNEEEVNQVLFFDGSDSESEQSDVGCVESDVESEYDMHRSDEFDGDESDTDEDITIHLDSAPEVWRQEQKLTSALRVKRTHICKRSPTKALAPVHRAILKGAPSTSRDVESVPSTSRETPVHLATTPKRSALVARSARLAMRSSSPVQHYESSSESCIPGTPGASDRASYFSQRAVPLPRLCKYSYHIFISIFNLCIYCK